MTERAQATQHNAWSHASCVSDALGRSEPLSLRRLRPTLSPFVLSASFHLNHNQPSSSIVMPPRKKQRIDDYTLPIASVPRRTTRASAKAALELGGVAADDLPVVTNTIEKTRTILPDVNRCVTRKGHLKALPDLALEIQFEVSYGGPSSSGSSLVTYRPICQIYNYLDLGDLFNLARTCKKFRAFFLDKALEKRLWVPARANTPGLPEQPPFMSEYSFLHLLYSPYCHVCIGITHFCCRC